MMTNVALSSQNNAREGVIAFFKKTRRLFYPANMLPKPSAAQIAERLRKANAKANPSPDETERQKILSQLYSKEEMRKLIHDAIEGLTVKEKILFVSSNLVMKNMHVDPVGIARRLTIQSAGRALSDKCLYRGIAAPIHPGFHQINTRYTLGTQQVNIGDILEIAASPDFQEESAARKTDIHHAINRLFQSVQSENLPISLSASASVAARYAREKLAMRNVENDRIDIRTGESTHAHEAASIPVIFEIKGEPANPARVLPAIGFAFLGGAEDEIYCSPLTEIFLETAKKNQKNQYVVTVTAKDLSEEHQIARTRD